MHIGAQEGGIMWRECRERCWGGRWQRKLGGRFVEATKMLILRHRQNRTSGKIASI
jgi:hypothetical protein